MNTAKDVIEKIYEYKSGKSLPKKKINELHPGIKTALTYGAIAGGTALLAPHLASLAHGFTHPDVTPDVHTDYQKHVQDYKDQFHRKAGEWNRSSNLPGIAKKTPIIPSKTTDMAATTTPTGTAQGFHNAEAPIQRPSMTPSSEEPTAYRPHLGDETPKSIGKITSPTSSNTLGGSHIPADHPLAKKIPRPMGPTDVENPEIITKNTGGSSIEPETKAQRQGFKQYQRDINPTQDTETPNSKSSFANSFNSYIKKNLGWPQPAGQK
jgi:hypothetical protein